MNVDTGEIRPTDELTAAEKTSGKWTPLDESEAEQLRKLPSWERAEHLRRRREDKKRSQRSRRNAMARKSRQRNRR